MLTQTMAKQAGKRKKEVDKNTYTPPTKSKKGGSNVVKQLTEANSANNAPASTDDTNPPAASASSDTNANNTKVSGTNGTDGTINEQAGAHNATATKTTNNIIIAMVEKMLIVPTGMSTMQIPKTWMIHSTQTKMHRVSM